ncbi:MAG: hypothetical protein MMC23_006863 [Stictis urceolatum]|nr:hypothetical protein [Stictis urceolata]
MKFSTLSWFLLLALARASEASEAQPESTAPWDPIRSADAQATVTARLNESIPMLEDSAENLEDLPRQKHYLSPALQQFIFQLNGLDEKPHLEARQAAGGLGGGVVGPATLPTQAPTVTSFVMNGVATPYTQKFVATPDPWPTPAKGSVGLGTHTGKIGVVKTQEASADNLRAREVGAAVVGVGLGGYLVL